MYILLILIILNILNILNIILLIRLHFFHVKNRKKLIDIVFKNQSSFDRYHNKYLYNGSYFNQLYDVRKWTFDQYYPELKELNDDSDKTNI